MAVVLGFPFSKKTTKCKSSFLLFHYSVLSLEWIYVLKLYHVQHEAGHFLIAYLLGVLPKGYTITSLDTLINQGSLNVQAGTAFVDYEFVGEVNSINF